VFIFCRRYYAWMLIWLLVICFICGVGFGVLSDAELLLVALTSKAGISIQC
jgi:hypothetical protein